MMRSTSLVRIRFPYDLVDRLDRFAERLRLKGKRKIPRAALVRALVQIHMRVADDDRRELDDAIGADPVKRGRSKRLDAVPAAERGSTPPRVGGVRGRGARGEPMPARSEMR